MKTTSILLIFGIFIAALMAGCSSSNGGGSTSNYYPHSNGNSWNYSQIATLIGTAESLTVNADPQVSTIKTTFNGTTSIETVGVVQILKQETTIATAVSTTDSLVLANDDGVWTYGTSSAPSTTGLLMYDFPLSLNKSWTITGSYEGTVIGQETVTTDAGTFNCYKIQLTNNAFADTYNSITFTDFTYIVWLGDGAGIVKWSFTGAGTGSYVFPDPIGTKTGTFSVSLAATLTSKNF